MANSLKNIENGRTKTSSTNPSIPTASPDPNLHFVPEIPTRKGIMFTSSIAINTDIKRYEDELKCDLKIVATDFIEPNANASEPDSYLGAMVNQHLRGKSEYHFAIIATGTNDITKLDPDSPPTTSFSEVSTQSQTLFDVAESITKEMNIDVFVVDKPPRYDSAADPMGMKQKLTKYSNGVLASTTGPTPKIFLVEQASLGRSAEKARAEIFQNDGINLTTKGVNFYNKNIINVISECYPETLQLQKQEVRGQGAGRGGSDGQHHGQARGRGQAAVGGLDQGAGRGHRPRG